MQYNQDVVADTDTERQFFRSRSGSYQTEAYYIEVERPKPNGFKLIGMIAVAATCAVLAAMVFSGCSSPPDQCGEVSQCGGDDVDGSAPDQPDGNVSNCATTGTCPDASSSTDAAPTATCAPNAWMENPEMFNCDFFQLDGSVYTAHSCDPELLPVTTGCSIKCGPFWAAPNQLTMDIPNHSFDWYDTPDRPYPTYRCVQRLE